MVAKKQLLAVLALIAVAVTTIAWAQATYTSKSATITLSEASITSLPDLVVEGGIKRTVSASEALTLKVYFRYTVVRVSLVDLAGLYEYMEQFVVTFKDHTSDSVLAVLTLDEPVAEFVYTAPNTAKQGAQYSIDIVVSYVAVKKIPRDATITYAVSAEVVDVYGDKLPQT